MPRFRHEFSAVGYVEILLVNVAIFGVIIYCTVVSLIDLIFWCGLISRVACLLLIFHVPTLNRIPTFEKRQGITWHVVRIGAGWLTAGHHMAGDDAVHAARGTSHFFMWGLGKRRGLCYFSPHAGGGPTGTGQLSLIAAGASVVWHAGFEWQRRSLFAAKETNRRGFFRALNDQIIGAVFHPKQGVLLL